MLLLAGVGLAGLIFVVGCAWGSYSSRHTHRWSVTSCEYTPPQDKHFKGRGYNTLKIISHILHGFTSVSLVCESCGEPRVIIMDGLFVPLDDKTQLAQEVIDEYQAEADHPRQQG